MNTFNNNSSNNKTSDLVHDKGGVANQSPCRPVLGLLSPNSNAESVDNNNSKNDPNVILFKTFPKETKDKEETKEEIKEGKDASSITTDALFGYFGAETPKHTFEDNSGKTKETTGVELLYKTPASHQTVSSLGSRGSYALESMRKELAFADELALKNDAIVQWKNMVAILQDEISALKHENMLLKKTKNEIFLDTIKHIIALGIIFFIIVRFFY